MKQIKRIVSVLLVIAALCSLLVLPANAAGGMVDVTAYFAGKTITMQSVENGKYLCADSDAQNAPLRANRDAASTWETFTVSGLTADGWVGIRAHNGKYLSAVNDRQYAPVMARAGHLQSWECFRIYQYGSDFYIKAQVNGNWFSVRVNKDHNPVLTCVNGASTWERIRIRVVNEAIYISPAEIATTAAANGIAPGTNAYKALQSLNSTYAARLSDEDERGTVVAMFEGVGSDASASLRMNAMCVVIRNGDIVYLNRNCTTIPDRPFDPYQSGVRYSGTSTVRSGVYRFNTVNHKGYAALRLVNATSVRHTSRTSCNVDSATGIDVHRRYTARPYTTNGGTANSSGCMLVGRTGTASTGEYARFIQALRIVGANARGNAAYANKISGRFILDRTYAADYLKRVGYTDAAIRLIG